MSNDGGAPYGSGGSGSGETTSYGLQPPRPQEPGAPYGGVPQGQQPQQGGYGYPGQQQGHGQPPQGPGPHPGQQAPPAPPAPYAQPTQAVPHQQAQPDPGAGRLIAGRYRLLAKLGHGGMGTVWRAKDETVDREVAVKEPRVPDHLPERERATVFERMRREARAAARLDHPAVVSVHDVAVEDGQPWIVMEFVQGRTLGEALQEGTLGAREAARIGLEVLGALDAAHQGGVLHRDVKPDNVLLGRHERVVLTDFGIAQIEGETNLTDTGGFVGSPEFIAPERVLGQRPGPASDLWSLGVVLYAATEGVSPFRRNNTPATLQSVLNATPAAPASARGPLADAINGLLHKDPAQRPAAARVRQLLEQAAAPAPPPAPTVRAAGPGGAQGVTLSRKALLGIGAVLVAAVLAVGVVLADPFGGSSAEGWKDDEAKGLGATVSVPESYVKYVPEEDDSDQGWAEYTDPSGAIWVRLQVDAKKDDSLGNIAGSATAEAYDDAETFQETGESDLGIGSDSGLKMHTDKTTYKGGESAENTGTYTEGTGDDRRHPREIRIFYYKSKAGDMYKLIIGYPGKGDFVERGREVADGAIENLEISKL
ncbi:serine/threonine protein kinase [Streptomyces albus]|uniref:non-specific serine/threonine protein kinase n=1 Tax=Streptomyces albus (strain ATCC 21838 / DSM 41398 / FERM P-419 / JCM 4703 / NBRC 107858) TaxID=1081613 RepID=A0A0B5EQI9_STRA4|nr:serine/threonine protein kinase [Streptomyces albus]AOU79339.1 serine/threonine protein kinase [Streptomyces albus]AYN35066.1 serine/threonine protein kinase [Streptomyces albus]